MPKCARNPKPETRNPKPETRNPKPVSWLASVVFGAILILSTAASNAYSFTEIDNNWELTSDFTGSIRISRKIDLEAKHPVINLQGHRLTLNYEGIEIKAGAHSSMIFGGIVTTSESFLNVRSLGNREFKNSASLYIDSVIADSTHSTGVRFSGGYGGLVLEGNQSNTFTGNVEVSGPHTALYLNKSGGATAVRGDIFMNRGSLYFYHNQQLLTTSSVSLKNNARIIYSALSNDSLTNTFRKLVIEGEGTIDFDHSDSFGSLDSKYSIYLDDLIINGSGHLTVDGWQDGRDFLLVRKTSANLADALTKMTFSGSNPANIHLCDFDSDYWQISALPEPATYGAILGTAGIGLWCWQKRRRRPDRSTA